MKEKNGSLVSIQSNPFIESRRTYTAIQAKILHISISRINPQLPKSRTYDEAFSPIVIKKAELVQMLGDNHKYYDTLGNICEDMIQKFVEIPRGKGKKGKKLLTVFSQLEYSDDGLIIVFNSMMVPYILKLVNERFTKIPLTDVLLMTSSYAIRLLELLLQYKNVKGSVKKRTIGINELKFYMGVSDNQYKRTTDFRKRVLDDPIRELNEKTNYHVRYETIKKGRKITHFTFYYTIKEDKAAEELPVDAASFSPAAEKLIGIGFSRTKAEKLIIDYGEERVKDNVDIIIKRMSKHDDIENITGYVISAIEDDYASEIKEEELQRKAYLKAEKERKRRKELERQASRLGMTVEEMQKEAEDREKREIAEEEARVKAENKKRQKLAKAGNIEEALGFVAASRALEATKAGVPFKVIVKSMAKKCGLTLETIRKYYADKLGIEYKAVD